MEKLKDALSTNKKTFVKKRVVIMQQIMTNSFSQAKPSQAKPSQAKPTFNFSAIPASFKSCLIQEIPRYARDDGDYCHPERSEGSLDSGGEPSLRSGQSCRFCHARLRLVMPALGLSCQPSACHASEGWHPVLLFSIIPYPYSFNFSYSYLCSCS